VGIIKKHHTRPGAETVTNAANAFVTVHPFTIIILRNTLV